jgi:exodeoxyribonuclease VII small subunit
MSDPGIEDPRRFEASLSELEAIVERLEQGELSLEESLGAFERGVQLTRACQQALDQAEQRVRILTQEGGDDSDAVAFVPQSPGSPDAD